MRLEQGIRGVLRQRPLAVAPRLAGSLPPVWLALLFTAYGPALNVVGELRYVEIAVLALLLLNAGKAYSCVGPWERYLVALFLLAAGSQVVSDVVNEAKTSGTLKRAGTYIILALLVVALKWLSRGDPRRILLIMTGYCVSWVFIMFVGTSGSAGYTENPWRLGLGFAATMFLCILIATFRPVRRFGGIALIALAGLHLALQSRSMVIITGFTGVLVLLAQVRGSQWPLQFRPGIVLMSAVAAGIAVLTVFEGIGIAMQYKLLPDELQEKMEKQASSPHGILAAGRPDTIAALYAVSKQPLLGYGSTNVDPEVYAYYMELAWSSYIWESNYTGLLETAWNNEWTLGTPSHSHLLGAWVDAGVLAALCWFAVLLMALKIIVRMSLWQHAMQPFVVLIALTTLWDVLFSPGPHRMDMALRLTILIYGLELLEVYDWEASNGRRPPAPIARAGSVASGRG